MHTRSDIDQITAFISIWLVPKETLTVSVMSVYFLFQRTFIDLFVQRVHSGQRVAESLKAGICCWTLVNITEVCPARTCKKDTRVKSSCWCKTGFENVSDSCRGINTMIWIRIMDLDNYDRCLILAQFVWWMYVIAKSVRVRKSSQPNVSSRLLLELILSLSVCRTELYSSL